MFAIIKTGGKQYRVAEGDVVRIEKLEAQAGSTVELTDVILVNDGKKDHIGGSAVAGATITATVVEQMRDRKVIIFKKTRRHNYRRKNGHRQHLTVLKITKIALGK
ncbi:50S ribosomal protein L21 [Candidatus Odyssella thessalonicensis]|uniref:50S ribosomal protein L21 n=1 Tax=Candidatus Odyssella thessalonicensis TaxID=84647 RepID=UPI000225B6E9|nr:50S ribosomal protein L21 [Candidatus Odyssella thessalonicensis]